MDFLKSLFKWAESQVFFGTVVRDYGVIAEEVDDIRTVRWSVTLCERNGKRRLVFKAAHSAFLSRGATYFHVPESAATRLGEIAQDLAQQNAFRK